MFMLDSSQSLEIDRSIIEAALEKSPTGGNAKPFSWTWQNGSLQVRHHVQAAQHYLNRNQHTSLIALGCLIASVEIAAGFQGFQVESQVSFSDLSAKFIFVKGGRIRWGMNDYQALFRRRTYREQLKPSPKPNVSAVSLGSDIIVQVAGCESISKEMKNFLIKADTYLWRQNQATRDFLAEIHFTDQAQTKGDRGIRVVDLGVGKMDQMLLKVFNLLPWLPTFFSRIPGLNSSFRNASLRSQKNAHYVLISSSDLDSKGLVRAGQQALRTWLQLEDQGYHVQPISLASITLVDAATGFLPDDTAKAFRQLFKTTGPQILKRQFGLNDNQHPVWLFRVGR